MRPDYVRRRAPAADCAAARSPARPPVSRSVSPPAEAPVATNPAAGLPGMMMPPGGGS